MLRASTEHPLSMADDHYMPFFVGDFLASTATWTGPERGLYIQMLALEWSSGPLPADPDRLARVLGYIASEFELIWPTVRAKFKNGDGKLINVRLEEHRAKNAELAAKRHDKAVHAANSKHAKSISTSMPGACSEQVSGIPPSMPSTPIRSDLDLLRTKPVSEKPMSASPTVDDPARRVFEHWMTIHDRPKCVLNAARRKLIQARLKEFSESDLCQSIAGYLNSPHHMGQNDRDTVYNDIGLFLRDSKHVEAGLQFYRQPPRKNLSAKTRQNVDAIADWVPPEARRAAK